MRTRTNTSRARVEPKQNFLERVINPMLLIGHNLNLPVLYYIYAVFGDRVRIYGGRPYLKFREVQALMAADYEKLDWLHGPMDDRADYLTKGYMAFLQPGPNHRLRREHIAARVELALQNIDELEALLREESEIERALVRFLFRYLGGIEASEAEIDDLLEFRKWGGPLTLLPKWMRATVFKKQHERIRALRPALIERMEAAGEPIAGTMFNIIWFQSNTLTFYPLEALELLRRRKYRHLMPGLREEAERLPAERAQTRSLIYEVVRRYTRLTATFYLFEGEVKVAAIPKATIDPERYECPHRIDLDRDHSDAIGFAGPSSTRSCVGQALAVEMMACVLARELRGAGM